jgi:hypothetical protein
MWIAVAVGFFVQEGLIGFPIRALNLFEEHFFGPAISPEGATRSLQLVLDILANTLIWMVAAWLGGRVVRRLLPEPQRFERAARIYAAIIAVRAAMLGALIWLAFRFLEQLGIETLPNRPQFALSSWPAHVLLAGELLRVAGAALAAYVSVRGWRRPSRTGATAIA